MATKARYNIWMAPAVVALACGLLLVGCQGAKVHEPMAQAFLSGQSDSNQMDFWHELTQRPVVDNDEAFHALLLYIDGKDEQPDYAARVKLLKSRHMLPGWFSAGADRAITRGDLAVAIVKALEIKGGVMLHLTGNNPRYATRELVYNGLYPQSSEYQTFTGQAFVGIIGRMEDYQRKAQGKPEPGAAVDGTAVTKAATTPGPTTTTQPIATQPSDHSDAALP